MSEEHLPSIESDREKAVRLLAEAGTREALSRALHQADFSDLVGHWQSLVGQTIPITGKIVDAEDSYRHIIRKAEDGEISDYLPPERYTVVDVVTDSSQQAFVRVRHETDRHGRFLYTIKPQVEFAPGIDAIIVSVQPELDPAT